MIELLYPWLLILIPLPLLIWLVIKPKQPRLTSIRTPLFTNWNAIQQNQSVSSTKLLFKNLLTFIIWTLIVTATARPQWIDEPIELPTSGRDLLLSIDISGSMEEEDLQLEGKRTNRLEVVKSILSEFIEKREGDRLGLVLFGEKAYLQTPLTFDLQTVQFMLDETVIGLAGASRTAIGDGIGLSIKRLRERPAENRVLILLTDGRNNSGELDPIEAAKLAKHAGIKIYTIGVGADKQTRRSLLFGTTTFNPSAELDEETLKVVAKLTGGQYFRARSSEELAQIYDLLDQLEPVEDKPEIYRPIQELYFWALLAALGFLILPVVINLIGGLINRSKTSSVIDSNKGEEHAS
ncbi:MAG: VWA domain-containing protein [Kangiellaceae bacterium]|nr:VWA domain-containing protein [Kangiellaceae bacterium]